MDKLVLHVARIAAIELANSSKRYIQGAMHNEAKHKLTGRKRVVAMQLVFVPRLDRSNLLQAGTEAAL